MKRKLYQRINIYLPDGRHISVQPVEIGQDDVKLGIDAPNDIRIFRSEIDPFLNPSPEE